MQKSQGNEMRGKLRYVIIELIGEKGAANSIEKGLFKGLKEESGQTFMWIRTSSSVSRACNLTYYTILSIEAYDGESKLFTFFQADKAEQAKAFEKVKEITSSLFDLVHKVSGLIDVDKYTDVPDNFDEKSSPQSSTIGSKSIQRSTYHRTNHQTTFSNRNGDFYNSYPYRHKDPEPCAFKRSTRKPTKAALKKLNAKLDQIDEGTYEYKIPAVQD